jgi:hypothetical protein
LQVAHHRVSVGGTGVNQQADAYGRLWNKLLQKAKLLRPKVTEQKVHPGCVTAWTSEGGDETELDRIIRDVEHDRDIARGSFRGECRGVETATISATCRRAKSAAMIGSRSY